VHCVVGGDVRSVPSSVRNRNTCKYICGLLFHRLPSKLLIGAVLTLVTIPMAVTSTRSGAKKPPTPLDFNPADPLHAEFVYSAANLRATMYGIQPACPDPQTAAGIASGVTVERFR
jgi:hypothetical protein